MGSAVWYQLYNLSVQVLLLSLLGNPCSSARTLGYIENCLSKLSDWILCLYQAWKGLMSIWRQFNMSLACSLVAIWPEKKSIIPLFVDGCSCNSLCFLISAHLPDVLFLVSNSDPCKGISWSDFHSTVLFWEQLLHKISKGSYSFIIKQTCLLYQWTELTYSGTRWSTRNVHKLGSSRCCCVLTY